MSQEPDNAGFAPAHLQWLATGFLRVARAVLATPWAWAPAVALTLLSLLGALEHGDWSQLTRGWVVAGLRVNFDLAALVDYYLKGSWALFDLHLRGPGMVLLFALFILLMAPARRLMIEAAGYSPSRAWGTQILLGLSAAAGIVLYGAAHMALLTDAGRANFLQKEWTRYFEVLAVLVIPVISLLAGIYLSLLYECATGGVATLAGIARRALGALRPLAAGYVILGATSYALILLAGRLYEKRGWNLSEQGWFEIATTLLYGLFFLTPVIVVVEQCGLFQAVVLNFRFIRAHLWRYIALVLLGTAVLALPAMLAHTFIAGVWFLQYAVVELVKALLCILFIAFAFRYYVREAGVRDERAS